MDADETEFKWLNRGAQGLWRWRYDRRITQKEAVKMLSTRSRTVYIPQLSRWENGHDKPGRTMAVRIESITCNAVTCGSWDLAPLPDWKIDPTLSPDFNFAELQKK
mgnify:CR=1 FL=1